MPKFQIAFLTGKMARLVLPPHLADQQMALAMPGLPSPQTIPAPPSTEEDSTEPISMSRAPLPNPRPRCQASALP